MNVLNYVKTEHLKGEQRELAELVGIEAYRKIVAHYGGEKLGISRIDSIILANRKDIIKNALEHEKEDDVAAFFHITKRELERIKAGCK